MERAFWIASTLSVETLLAACGGGDEPLAREEAQGIDPGVRAVAAAAGSDAATIAYLNRIFGTHLPTLEELKAYKLQSVQAAFDTNLNGFVCVFDLRGRRASSGDPYFNLTFFGVTDARLTSK